MKNFPFFCSCVCTSRSVATSTKVFEFVKLILHPKGRNHLNLFNFWYVRGQEDTDQTYENIFDYLSKKMICVVSKTWTEEGLGSDTDYNDSKDKSKCLKILKARSRVSSSSCSYFQQSNLIPNGFCFLNVLFGVFSWAVFCFSSFCFIS